MCKQYATSIIQLSADEDLDNIKDLRVHGGTYMLNATNAYKVCLSGIRRQKY